MPVLKDTKEQDAKPDVSPAPTDRASMVAFASREEPATSASVRLALAELTALSKPTHAPPDLVETAPHAHEPATASNALAGMASVETAAKSTLMTALASLANMEEPV